MGVDLGARTGPPGPGCAGAAVTVEPSPNGAQTFHMSAQEVAAKIGIPLRAWPGNCFAIATAMVEAGLCPVGSVVVYGHWLGQVCPGSMFYSSAELGFCRHGWVLKPDGGVIDPTRFVFDAPEGPYIYEGPGDYYDEGGNRQRARRAVPVPAFGGPALSLDLGPEVVDDLLGGDPRVDAGRAYWLANLPYGADVAKVLIALADAGLGALVPWDNLQRARREFSQASAARRPRSRW